MPPTAKVMKSAARIVRHAGSAVMMAVDEKKRILLVRQYRLPAGMAMWELPAGRLDPGEKPLQAAKRELIEETGYRARKWRKLASFYASPGYVAEKMTIFLATDLIAGEAQPMEDERIESPLVLLGGDRPHAAVGKNYRRKDDDRLPHVEEIRVGGSGPLNA